MKAYEITDSVTESLVSFAHQLDIHDIPSDVIRSIRLHALDTIGCGWAGSIEKSAQCMLHSAAAFGGEGRSFTFGGSRRLGPAGAAMVNAFMANVYDHDDGVEINGKGLGHPGATLVAAAMAALDLYPKCSSSRLLSSLVAGFEVNNRLIHAMQPSAERFHEVYGVCQHQAIGAAIVAGKLAGLDIKAFHHAVGLAATMTAVPSLHKCNWQDRPLASLKDAGALASQAGIQAVIMAKHGMIGAKKVFDGPQGYWRMLGSDRFDIEGCLNGLGKDWYARFGSFKRYPVCRWLACAIECLDEIVQRTRWKPQHITQIRVQTFSAMASGFMDYHPQSATDAQFSLPYAMAAIVWGVPIGPAWYTPELLHSVQLRETAAKVSVEVVPRFDLGMKAKERRPAAHVTVTHSSGRQACQELLVPLGGNDRPMSEDEVIAKATRNMSGHADAPFQVIASVLEVKNSYLYDDAQAWVGAPKKALNYRH